jgi:hypothetical protein
MKWLRFGIILLIQSGCAFLIAFTIDAEFSYMSLSDAFFVIGILIGMPTIVAITQAFRLFYGFRYAFRIFVTPSYKKIHPTFNDYQQSKTDENPNQTFFAEVIISSLLMIIVAYILSRYA